MKKFLITLFMTLGLCVSVFAQTTETPALKFDTPVKFEISKDGVTPQLFALVNYKTVKLGEISPEMVLPEGTVAIMAGRNSKRFNCGDLGLNDELYVDVKNPGLANFGVVLTCVGSLALGAGLGFALSALQYNDASAYRDFALGLIIPGVVLTGTGLGLNLGFRSTITKK